MELKFDERGLIPAIVQDAISGRVLMFAWMNAESLRLTQARGEAVFWSRSRNELWHKGATSGNVLTVRELRADCDADVLLIRAMPAGPACHTGEESCFFQTPDGAKTAPPSAGFLDELEGIVAARRARRRTTAIPRRCLQRAATRSRKKSAKKASRLRWPVWRRMTIA